MLSRASYSNGETAPWSSCDFGIHVVGLKVTNNFGDSDEFDTVIQVGVILYSSLTRLLLYEEAYGFTRLRTYTYVFIPWMALVLGAALLLLFQNKLNRIAHGVVVGVIGVVATLNLLNVDAFIVK